MNHLILALKRKVPGIIRFWKNQYFCNRRARKIQNQRNAVFENQRKMGLDSIPIFLISFNRLSYIKSMISSLEKKRKKNIIIIDNASTYPPLLEYYESIPYKVIRLDTNWGFQVFWNNPMFEVYRKSFYIISDPDVEPIEECPSDFIEHFFDILYKHPLARKVGFSLKIDDLPENGILTKQVIKWEKKYNKTYIKKDSVFYAQIDTTFALYVPDDIAISSLSESLRTAYPYQARHMPWYKNPQEITEEDKYYAEHKTNGWWNVVEGKMTPDKVK